MFWIPKRKAVARAEVPDSNDQPWATAHLRHQSPNVPAKESAPKSILKKSKTSTPTKGEQTRHTDNTTMPTEDVDAITPLPRHQVRIDPVAGHSNVTKPARPTRKHTYSELFDLKDLAPGSQIRSPSGQMLSAEQAASRADRPKGIEERQEAIRRKVAEHQESQKQQQIEKQQQIQKQQQGRQRRLGNEVTVIGDSKGKQKREEERKKKQREQKWRRRKEEWKLKKAQVMEYLNCCCQ